MKTLDKVINAEKHCVSGGCIGCPYENDEDGCNCDEDALHYLLEYQDRKETLRNWTEKAISVQQNLSDAITFMQAYRDDKDDLTALRAYWKEQHENNALTWDELKQMEGKPVWVEALLYKQWAIIADCTDTHVRFEGVRLYAPESRVYMGADNGWQAYRKERG